MVDRILTLANPHTSPKSSSVYTTIPAEGREKNLGGIFLHFLNQIFLNQKKHLICQIEGKKTAVFLVKKTKNVVLMTAPGISGAGRRPGGKTWVFFCLF